MICLKVLKGLLNIKIIISNIFCIYIYQTWKRFIRICYLNANCIFSACKTPIHDICYYIRVVSIILACKKKKKRRKRICFIQQHQIARIPVLGIMLTLISPDTEGEPINFKEFFHNGIQYEDKPCVTCQILRHIKVLTGFIILPILWPFFSHKYS